MTPVTEPVLDEELQEVIETPIEGEEQVLKSLAKSTARGKAALRGAARLLNAAGDDISPEDMKNALAEYGFGHGKPKPAKKVEKAAADDTPAPEKVADLKPYEALLKAEPELREEIVQLVKADSPMSRSALAIFQRQAARIAKAEKDAADAAVARERDRWVGKAKELQAFPGNTDQVGALLFELAKSETVYTRIEKAEGGKETEVKETPVEVLFGMLKAADAQLRDSALLTSIGSGQPKPGSAMDQLKQLAKGIIAKGEGKMTEAQAFAEAVRQNPELKKRYSAERKAAAH